MNNSGKVVTGLLVGSIILNIIFFFSLNSKIEEKYERLSMNQDNLSFRVSSEMDGIYSRIQEIGRETIWILSEDFSPNVDESSEDGIVMDFEWTFRELAEGSDVRLLYREEGKSQWDEQAAKNIGGLNFSAKIKISPEKDYQYQIVSEGALSKSSEVKWIPGSLYKPTPLIPVEWGSSRENGEEMLTWRFEQDSPHPFDFYRVYSAVATVTFADGSKKEIELEKSVSGTNYDGIPIESWELEVENKNLFEIILRVEYNNGIVHEGEIFPDDHEYYMKFDDNW
ncbi:hypothetical protein ACLIA0_10865 [Bacillaceae bacterium W0354]